MTNTPSIAEQWRLAVKNKDAGTPLHTCLADFIRERVQEREWRQGLRIPSEHELMLATGLSRGTVRHAIQTLVDDGVLLQRHGKGTFVRENDINHGFGERNLSFAASFMDQGKDFVTRVIEQEVLPASERVAHELGVRVGEEVLHLKRLRVVDAEPALFQESWLNLTVCPGLDEADFVTESAFDAVERCSGRKIRYSKMRYSSAQANRECAFLLDCEEGSAVLVLEQTISLDNRTAIEWSTSWLRGDQTIAGLSVQPERPASYVRSQRDLTAGTIIAEQIPRAARQPQLSRAELERRAIQIRRKVVEMSRVEKGMPLHVGGSFSCAEIFATLLGDVMYTGMGDGCPWDERDRFVLSKGHASAAFYPALVQAGFLDAEVLEHGYVGPQARAYRQPRRDVEHGIEISGGSLGIGPGYAAGIALSLRKRHLPGQVFCLVGDGECNEGAVWEAAAFAGHNRLSNLTIIVDANGLQLDGPTSEVLGVGSLAAQFRAFGFEVDEVDGHDVIALRDALSVRSIAPRALIAKTDKGHGLSFTSNAVEWHDKVFDDEHYELALAELERAEEAIADEL